MALCLSLIFTAPALKNKSPQQLLATVLAEPAGVKRLVKLLQVLRGPGGCPWDREQTHQSLAQYLLEEAYEAVEAIDRGEQQALLEELGDVLLQVVFHAQLGQERGDFDLDQIAEQEVQKMIARHPHVFGDLTASSAGAVREQWENRKRQQKPRSSLADGVPKALAALTRAQTLTARASSLGFDWINIAEVLPKLNEELQELCATISSEGKILNIDDFEEELGDLIFAAVNLARKAGIDAEAALRKATQKFVDRFDRMQKPAGTRFDGPEATATWDAAWEQAKRN